MRFFEYREWSEADVAGSRPEGRGFRVGCEARAASRRAVDFEVGSTESDAGSRKEWTWWNGETRVSERSGQAKPKGALLKGMWTKAERSGSSSQKEEREENRDKDRTGPAPPPFTHAVWSKYRFNHGDDDGDDDRRTDSGERRLRRNRDINTNIESCSPYLQGALHHAPEVAAVDSCLPYHTRPAAGASRQAGPGASHKLSADGMAAVGLRPALW
ncbi:hypothetical protein K504DRAFT_505609 [Pleomassaria siparia CBS 279.74]|uniref:Uncharacterized protein n=1 Tax=Pleomassaria siparia CBS 279.74 TaxID=1314801 RepID=A0A6G1JZV5_9PLEO|nr:hypothetical protein K504DRAFT_505609 [Pleomassaria siparia CBS 279.74]